MDQTPQPQKHQPGIETEMKPRAESTMKDYKAAGKLSDKVALVTGGDSGIGRAVSIGFAKEGADIALVYLEEDKDAEDTLGYIEAEGRECIKIRGDITDPGFCKEAVKRTVSGLGGLDVLVNNAGEIHMQEDIADIKPEQLKRTFETNIFAMFYLTQAALEHMKEGGSIICTASSAAYEGYEEAIDYAASKGAVVTFMRSMASALAKKEIRVNAVAPGPTWTPLMASSADKESLKTIGDETLFGRMAQPDEIAPAYIFLASDDACFVTGQVIHPDGGSTMAS